MGKRTARVSWSSYSGDERWHPDDTWGDEQRSRLEEAYGFKLEGDSWDELVRHVRTYSVYEVEERNSATVDEVDKALLAASSAAGRLLECLLIPDNLELSRPVSDLIDEHADQIFRPAMTADTIWTTMAAEADAAMGVDHNEDETPGKTLVHGWRASGYFRTSSLTDRLIEDLYELQGGVSAARASFKQDATTREGDAWVSLIQGLSRWADAYRYPRAAANSTEKTQKVEDASPFVRFVMCLQEQMPKTSRRHNHSVASLASAINRALAK